MKLFFDLDGTLAVFNKDATIEEYSMEGYYGPDNLPAQLNVVKAVSILYEENYDVYVASSVLNDDHSIRDKNKWVDYYVPFIDMEHRIYIPYGVSKVSYLKKLGILEDGDVLIDDLSLNLHDWEKESEIKLVGVKIINPINNTKGSWRGFKAHYDSRPDVIAKTIAAATV